MIKAGIIGGTGYTGVELLRLLHNHPKAEVVAISSRSLNGKRVDRIFPSLLGKSDLCFSLPDDEALNQCDVVFLPRHMVLLCKVRATSLKKALK